MGLKSNQVSSLLEIVKEKIKLLEEANSEAIVQIKQKFNYLRISNLKTISLTELNKEEEEVIKKQINKFEKKLNELKELCKALYIEQGRMIADTC